MDVLLLFPSIFPILHMLVFFPFPLLLFYQFFLISFFLSVLISTFSASYLSSYHSSVRYPPLPSSCLGYSAPVTRSFSISFSHNTRSSCTSFSSALSLFRSSCRFLLLLFRVHALLPPVLYHSSFTSSDMLCFLLFFLPSSYFLCFMFSFLFMCIQLYYIFHKTCIWLNAVESSKHPYP